MKRLLTLFALLALTLSACGAQAAPAMYIEPAKLTEEEESIAKLLGADTDQFLLDVVLDSTVRSFHVRYYDLDDGGQWHVFSESRMALDGSGTKGRMAFTYGDLSKGTREAVQFGKGVSAVSHTPPPEEDAGNSMSCGSSRLSERREVVYEEEIPLVLQVVTSKNGTVLYDVDHFFQPEAYEDLGSEHFYALTITFSQRSLGELEGEPEFSRQD